jgi:hypothetical protein
MTQMATDAIAVLVKRLARPHASGGMVIERSVILAEGANAAAILGWISDNDGVEDFTVASERSHGLHGAFAGSALHTAPARRFVLPARAFATVAPPTTTATAWNAQSDRGGENG